MTTTPSVNDEPNLYGPLTYQEHAVILGASCEKLRDRIDALTAERDGLAKFKAYVHERLDRVGVPHHPPGPHGAHGCRIGDRLDWLLAFTSGELPTAVPPQAVTASPSPSGLRPSVAPEGQRSALETQQHVAITALGSLLQQIPGGTWRLRGVTTDHDRAFALANEALAAYHATSPDVRPSVAPEGYDAGCTVLYGCRHGQLMLTKRGYYVVEGNASDVLMSLWETMRAKDEERAAADAHPPSASPQSAPEGLDALIAAVRRVADPNQNDYEDWKREQDQVSGDNDWQTWIDDLGREAIAIAQAMKDAIPLRASPCATPEGNDASPPLFDHEALTLAKAAVRRNGYDPDALPDIAWRFLIAAATRAAWPIRPPPNPNCKRCGGDGIVADGPVSGWCPECTGKGP